MKVSGHKTNKMSVLGYTPTQTLYWDSGDTQDFYMQDVTDPTNPIVYLLSPKEASVWFCDKPNLTTAYNPFIVGYPQLYLQFPYKDVD